ncbi:MAG TPA: hypothetical protein VE442_06960, partial [Jatrophihabitans sp.]|nr:hypothetical protein [Jatrophihabitans sp.]
ELLENERTARPDDPLWRGVAGMSVDGRSVLMDMRPRVEPQLRPVDGSDVSVSCHLYHPPEGTEPPPH